MRILHWPLWAASKDREDGDAHDLAAPDKRRALRLHVAIHVLIYGRLGNEPFSENAETVDVCTLGGLVPISARVRRSQKLILTNLQTDEELPCRVAHIVKAEDGRKLVGLAFLRPGRRFWRSGPPLDSPSSR